MKRRPVYVREHEGIMVVRDDLIPGGTKSRFLRRLFLEHDEIVYGTTASGGAQLALTYAAQEVSRLTGIKKTATLFVNSRKSIGLHERTLEARAQGAQLKFNPHNCFLLPVLQRVAKDYAHETGAHYLELGCPEAFEEIAHAAQRVNARYGPFNEIWSAAGSGVLTRGIQAGMHEGKVYAVLSGRDPKDVGRAQKIKYQGLDFHQPLTREAPFDSCPNIDRKAWEVCYNHTRKKVARGKKILFWNVMGASPTRFGE